MVCFNLQSRICKSASGCCPTKWCSLRENATALGKGSGGTVARSGAVTQCRRPHPTSSQGWSAAMHATPAFSPLSGHEKMQHAPGKPKAPASTGHMCRVLANAMFDWILAGEEARSARPACRGSRKSVLDQRAHRSKSITITRSNERMTVTRSIIPAHLVRVVNHAIGRMAPDL